MRAQIGSEPLTATIQCKTLSAQPQEGRQHTVDALKVGAPASASRCSASTQLSRAERTLCSTEAELLIQWHAFQQGGAPAFLCNALMEQLAMCGSVASWQAFTVPCGCPCRRLDRWNFPDIFELVAADITISSDLAPCQTT